MEDNKTRITTGGVVHQQSGQTIILTAPQRGGVDISHYMAAIRNAENIDWPRRQKLLDLYEDVRMDTHLLSVFRKHKASVLSTPIQFQRNGKVDERIQEHIDSPWFGRFLEDIIEDEWVGAGGSLFQFYRDNGWIKYDLIPRKHVDAVRRIIYRNQTDLNGISWDKYTDLLYIGAPRQLGEMAAVAFWVILKRNDVSDWAQFAEIFGQPMREGTYEGWDETARHKLIEDITALGAAPVFIHPTGTNIKLIESTQKTGTCDVFERLAVFCNSEISKAVLGNTLTTEAGKKGTQALGTVHQDEEEDITFFVKRRLLNVLNYEVSDIFQNLGIDTRGGKFSFVPPKKKDLTAKIVIDCKLKNEIGLPIADDYFYEEYGVPKPHNYAELKKEQEIRKSAVPGPVISETAPSVDEVVTQEVKTAASIKNRKRLNLIGWAHNFFVDAPFKGASKWQ